jgi:hypothetical protein
LIVVSQLLLCLYSERPETAENHRIGFQWGKYLQELKIKLTLLATGGPFDQKALTFFW